MSSLETSVTLEDVFRVVEAKRVPLAPELAGYLTLEVADGTDAGSGDVDPRTVFISEEGTVALVRPKKDGVTGEAEASVRRLLTKLLDASGSGTPALTTAAKRKPGNGLPALVEELEAALIPVNRAAGRRALARLAREVKRVLLGVGRNASIPPVREPSEAPKPPPPPPPKPISPAAPHARPPIRKKDDDPSKLPKAPSRPVTALPEADRPRPFGPEPATAKRAHELSELASGMNTVDSGNEAIPELGTTAPAPVVARLDAPPPRPPPAAGLPPPPAPKIAPPVPPPPPKREPPPPPIEKPKAPEPPPEQLAAPVFGAADVDSLLESFGVSHKQGDKQMARELKALAGLSPTPPPPDAKTLDDLTKDVGKDLPKKIHRNLDGDSVEALLALADASVPVRPPAAPMKVESRPAPVIPAPPQPPPPAPANLPPSPLFGGPAAPVPPESAPGAPAVLRHTAEALPPLPAPFPSEPRPEAVRPDPRPSPVESPKAGKYDSPRGLDLPKSRPTPAPTTSGQRPKLDATGPQLPPPQTYKRSRTRTRRAPRTGMAMLIFALVVLAGGTVAIWKFAPQVFTGHKRPVATVQPSAVVTAAPAPKCKVALVLTEVPANAEILLRMGQAPVDVERMPVGTRLELVATAEGHAPRRAVIKAEDAWNKGPDGKPRIEVPIQLDPSKAKPGATDPWPAAEPGSQVGGSGAPGTVHVVSNVRGAEVWLLAGLGPEARIDQLRCDADIDVLLAGPPTLRKRIHVAEKEIGAAAPDAQGNKVVNVSAK